MEKIDVRISSRDKTINYSARLNASVVQRSDFRRFVVGVVNINLDIPHNYTYLFTITPFLDSMATLYAPVSLECSR